MATSITSTTDKALSGLAPTFQTAIQTTIDSESQPLKRTQTQRDLVDVRRGIYADIKTNLDALQSAVQALISTQDTFGLNLTAKASITPGTAGSSVLTASAIDTAAMADYDLANIQLARAHSQVSNLPSVTSADMPMGISGSFWLGGSGLASVSDFTSNNTLTAAVTGSVATGQRELGQGSYTLQVRDLGGTRQFRLVNEDGDPVSIRSAGQSNSYTSSWQTLTNGSYDTGRGLALSLKEGGETGSTTLTYTARGTALTIGSSDTLRTVTEAINSANQPEGHAFKASIVGSRLVLTGAQTGEKHGILYSDDLKTALGLADVPGQTARNATFTVNGLAVSRANNTNLTDVVDGATLNLASDAEGKTAHLSIGPNTDKATTAMNALVSKFNTAFTHLTQKMATTSKTEGTKTTYTRGPLAGDNVFRGLRTDLFNQMNRPVTNSGRFKSLEEIGLSFDKDLKVTLDSSKFADAIKNHASDLTALLDATMGKLNTTLSNHTGSSGSLQNSLTSMDTEIKGFDQRISKYNESLNTRKQTLIDQYYTYQNQLSTMGQQFNIFAALTGTSVDTSG